MNDGPTVMQTAIHKTPTRAFRIGLLIGLIVTAIPLGLVSACVTWLMNEPGGGSDLLFSGQIDAATFTLVRDREFLEPDERLIAVQDETLTLDRSRAAFLTDRRFVMNNEGVVRSIDLVDVTDAEVVDEDVLMFTLRVSANEGLPIRVDFSWESDAEILRDVILAARDRERERERIENEWEHLPPEAAP